MCVAACRNFLLVTLVGEERERECVWPSEAQDRVARLEEQSDRLVVAALLFPLSSPPNHHSPSFPPRIYKLRSI